MKIFLDTNILIDLEKKNQKTIGALSVFIKEIKEPITAITWVNYYEFLRGSAEDELLDGFEFFDMDRKATDIFLKLKRQKTLIADFDLLIASVVIANDGILVTRDSDFQKISGLNLRFID